MVQKQQAPFHILRGIQITPNQFLAEVFDTSDRVGVKGRVCAVLKRDDRIIGVHECDNVVTDAGDLYYAQRAALLTTGTPISPVPTNFTDTNGVPDMIMELYNGASSGPAKANNRSNMAGLVDGGSNGQQETGYPKVNDTGNSENTGAGADVLTYAVFYTTAQVNASNIADVVLTNPDQGASEALLMHAEFAATFNKTSNDTLNVYINHTFTGQL